MNTRERGDQNTTTRERREKNRAKNNGPIGKIGPRPKQDSQDKATRHRTIPGRQDFVFQRVRSKLPIQAEEMADNTTQSQSLDKRRILFRYIGENCYISTPWTTSRTNQLTIKCPLITMCRVFGPSMIPSLRSRRRFYIMNVHLMSRIFITRSLSLVFSLWSFVICL